MKEDNLRCARLRCVSCGARRALIVTANELNPTAKIGSLVAWESGCFSCETKNERFVVEEISELLNRLAVAYTCGPSREAVEVQLMLCLEQATRDQKTIVQDYFDIGAGLGQLRRLIAETSAETGVADVYAMGLDRVTVRSVITELREKGVTLHSVERSISEPSS